jgi:hypothetical protein
MLKKGLLAAVACFALAYTSAQAQDLALNQPATASSIEGGLAQYGPANANDGNSSTRWSSEYSNHEWWQVDLGAIRSMNRVELNWEAAYARQYRIRTRTSTSNSWSTAATVTISSPGLKIHSFPARDARYVLIRGDQRATPWGISLWDARVFGPASSLPAPMANFSVSPDPAVRNSPTLFTSTGTCPDVPCTYEWFHGPPDSEPIGTGQTASFTYKGPAGERTVELRVTDQANRTASVTKTFDLVDAPPPPDNDADDDGVLDADDKCPSQPGPVSNNGCPTPSTGFPDASNTGVPAGTVLTPHLGDLTVTTAGAVIDSMDISGSLRIQAPNVTVRRTRVHGFGKQIGNWSTGLVVEDSEIDSGGANSTCFGVRGDVIMRRAELTGCENGFNVSGPGLVEDSWVHDLTTANGAHTDGAQVNQGASGWTFRHNTIDPVPGASGATSCIIMWNEEDPQNSNVRIEYNRLLGQGASFALYGPRQPASGIYITNNRIQRGVFGYTNSVVEGVTVSEFNGNVDDATGVLISG